MVSLFASKGVCVIACVCSSSRGVSCDVVDLVMGLCSISVVFAVFDCRSLIALSSSCVGERVGCPLVS